MKYILTAFIISILIHLLLLLGINPTFEVPSQSKSGTKQPNPASVHFVTLKAAQPKKIEKPIKKVEKPKPPVKTIKPKELKKVEKKVVQKPKREVVKKPQKIIEKPKPKFDEKKLPTFAQNNPTKLQKQIANQIEEDLLKWERVDSPSKKLIQKFYSKEEYEGLTKVQKVFIKDNLLIFRNITQIVLNRMGYPPMALRMQLSGINVVEFVFHPNGDISDLKITTSAGHEIFDNYTLELIEIAYKDYPRPKEATPIKFNVIYRYR